MTSPLLREMCRKRKVYLSALWAIPSEGEASLGRRSFASMHRFHLLLLILGFGHAVYAAAIYEFPDLIRRMPERTATPGCAYKGERYSHGDEVATTEPCLNCTCIRAVVVCYLRVCPSASSPPPGCFLAREVGQCCPSLVCGGDEKLKPKPSSSIPELRPTFATSQADITTTPITTTSAETTTTTESNSLVFVSSTLPDDEFPLLNDIGTNGGCLVNGTLYGDGSAMLSSTFCEYCFCIRGKTNCLRPKCDLVIDGCTPHYDSSFSCCPSRYDCFSKTVISDQTTVTTTASSTSTVYPTQFSDDFGNCVEDDRLYSHGEIISDYRACHSCICSNKSIICDEMKCAPPLEGCQPIIPEGHCCPVSYKCNYNDDINKYNVKGTNLDDSILDNVSTKSETKTVKQSEIFKNAHAPNAENKNQGSQDLSSFFHNFVPIHRRLDEEIYELYNSHDSEFNASQIAIGGFAGSQNSESQTTTFPSRENDKTLNLEIQSERGTTPSHSTSEEDIENASNSETDSDLVHEKEAPLAVSVGLPEVQTMSIESLINNFFVNNHKNYSESPTEDQLQRNNSKWPSSIVGESNLKTTLAPQYHKLFDSTTKSTEEHPTFSTPITSQEEQTFTESTLPDNTMITTKNFDSTMIQTTIYFTKDDDITDDTTSYIITGKDDKRTYLPISTNYRYMTQTTPTTNGDTTYDQTTLIVGSSSHESTTKAYQTTPIVGTSTGHTTKVDQSTTQVTKSNVRINSKLPISSYSGGEGTLDSRNPILEDSLVNLYLPAEGRDAEDSDDFTNVGSIHLGAPLSVDATELRKDPTNLRNKITESGGVIFMDPKYTDINPRLPSTANQAKPTEMNPMRDVSFNLTEHYPTPIDRADTESTHYDRKKGPRIQDGYNQTSVGQDYKIIPFVAEDAIRGKFGKGNNTLSVHRDTTQGLPDMVSDFCFIKGRIYMNGEMIVKPDPCELCRCFYGQELCQLQRCPTPPPDCIPEKLPAFCCPRFTCGENSGSKEQFSPEEKLPISSQPKVPIVHPSTHDDMLDKPKQSSYQPDETQFGIRFHPNPPITRPKVTVAITTQMSQLFTTRKPELIRTPADETPRSTRSTTTQAPEITKPPTSKIPDYNRISTTKQPEVVKTTKAASPPFSDPWGLLRVSGCNIYGKFFNINDQVEILSGPCSHCICTATGVECNDIC